MPSFQGDGVGLIVAYGLQRADFPLTVCTQIKAEGMSQLYASQPSNADASMDDYDEEEDDEDDMEEVME
jgi:hypothetical protein